jgi:predicted enzyme related to lactoylglutathione lyase
MAAKRTKAVARGKAPAKSPKPVPASRRAASAAPEVARKATPRKAAKRAKVPRARAGATAVMFQKVAFTMLSVEDPMRARNFYEQVLGLTRGLASPDGTWTEYDLPDGGCVALFRHPSPKAARAPGGGTSLALEVADLDTLNERLKAAGVVYEGDMVHGPHCRMSNILDSEGNSLILHQLNRH